MGNKFMKSEAIRKMYTLGDTLGTGSFATVKKGVRKSDKKEYAIKIIKKNKLNEEELSVVHDEVTIMHRVKHPNCVVLYEMFESTSKVYMVLELLTGGELFDKIVAKGSYSEKDAATLIGTITGAIKYLHSIGVVHRDLKPENLIYASNKDDSPIKITDFGLAKYQQEGSKMSTACGTPGYVAPEVLKNEKYGPPVDMWSIGVILYILLCGFPPFYHDNTSQLYKQIKKGRYDFPAPYWSDISPEAKNLVEGLLTVDPKDRLTPVQVEAHPWIGGASDKEITGGHSDRLKMLSLKRLLRKGVKYIIAVERFKTVLQTLVDAEAE